MTSGQPRLRVVVATVTTNDGEATDRLLLLLRWLQRQGVEVEVLAVGDGTALRRFREVAPLTVIDEFRRRGLARIPDLVGARRITAAIKSVRLRLWMRSRTDRTFFIHDPVAASALRYSPASPARVIAGLPDASSSLARLRPADLTTLEVAAGWVVSSAAQAEEVTASRGVPVAVLGQLVDPERLPLVDPGTNPATVVMVIGSDLWNQPGHATELTWRLLSARPDTQVRWLLSGSEDQWLAQHDAAAAGLSAVEIRDADSPDALNGAAVVVRTGYRPDHEDIVVAAVLGGVPVLDWADDDFLGPANLAPLDVDGSLETLCALLDDPQRREEVAARQFDRLADVDIDRVGRSLLELLSGR